MGRTTRPGRPRWRSFPTAAPGWPGSVPPWRSRTPRASGFLSVCCGGADRRVQRKNDAMLPAAGCAVVVVTSGEGRHGRGQLTGKGGAISGGREADLAIEGKGGQPLAGLVRSGDELADILNQLRGQREQPPG